MSNRTTSRRRKTAAVLAAAAAGTVGMGVFATTLSITSSGGFAAGSQAAAAGCDTDVTVTPAEPTWDSTSGMYTVSSVTVSGIDDAACLGATVTVDALRGDDSSIAHVSSTPVATGDTTKTINIAIPDANALATWAVIIH